MENKNYEAAKNIAIQLLSLNDHIDLDEIDNAIFKVRQVPDFSDIDFDRLQKDLNSMDKYFWEGGE